jgi:hypothetical protein
MDRSDPDFPMVRCKGGNRLCLGLCSWITFLVSGDTSASDQCQGRLGREVHRSVLVFVTDEGARWKSRVSRGEICWTETILRHGKKTRTKLPT